MEKDNKMDSDRLDEGFAENDTSSQYAMDFLTLRNAIIENCRDCIRDCGRDCLDRNVEPIESIRCPLQKVRIDFEIVIEEESQDVNMMINNKYYGFELK